MGDVDLRDLDHRGGEWLRGEGRGSETVISSRVRLARNLAGFPFVSRASLDERRTIVDRLRPTLDALNLPSRRMYVDVQDADDLLGAFLVERHLISRELQGAGGPRGVAFGSNEAISVMVNEEDHLRIQAIQSSLALEEAFNLARDIDTTLEQQVEYAASTRYGYLTACPTNVGTGVRASVMLHLPAMVQMKQIEKLFQAAQQTGFAVRGFYGEGTMATGDLYQISNQITLGRSEGDILDALMRLLPSILEYERRCRSQLTSNKRRLKFEDRCHRALATLRSARLLATDEAMQLLSLVRLGGVLKVFPELPISRINELLVLVQPAHVQKQAGETLAPEARDAARARLVRAALA